MSDNNLIAPQGQQGPQNTPYQVPSTNIFDENAPKTLLLLKWSDIIDVFHFPKSVVFKVRADKILGGIFWKDRQGMRYSDILMIKIPWVSTERNFDMFAERELHNEYADRENRNIPTLFKIEGFNNCFLRHKFSEVEIHDTDQVIKSRFVVSKYIKSILPEDDDDDDYYDQMDGEINRMKIDQQEEELKKKIYQQEWLLIKNGLYHNEMAMRNILYDGKDVYLIDFADAGPVPLDY